MTAPSTIAEAAAELVVDSRERQALLLIARETFDPWARNAATTVLVELFCEDLERDLAAGIVEELTR